MTENEIKTEVTEEILEDDKDERELSDYEKYYEYHQHEFTIEELETLPCGILDEYRFDLFQDLELQDLDEDDESICWLIEQHDKVVDVIIRRFGLDRSHFKNDK